MIPPRLQRPLVAAWISLGLHAALIALVQVAPPTMPRQNVSVIEARLVSAHAAPGAVKVPPLMTEVAVTDDSARAVPLLAPSVTAEALPVAEPVAQPAAQAATPTAPAPLPLPAAASAPTAATTPAAAITSSVDLTYYSAREVDVQPRALREVVPDYPADANQQQLSGRVRLGLKLEADGRVSDIEVVSANPPDIFDESALKAFRTARFVPAQKNGRPVRARILIEVVYDWEGRSR
jgi:protein TonB